MTAAAGVGIIGAGVISGQYLENLSQYPDVEVRFVGDIDVDRAHERAHAYGVPGSGTVDELLARDDIEIVVNLTIPAAHAEIGARILDAGKHVFGEKPLALSRAEGRELLDRAEHLDERREVVRAHVKQRAAAWREQEVGVRMPRVWSGRLEECESGERQPDRAFADRAAR